MKTKIILIIIGIMIALNAFSRGHEGHYYDFTVEEVAIEHDQVYNIFDNYMTRKTIDEVCQVNRSWFIYYDSEGDGEFDDASKVYSIDIDELKNFKLENYFDDFSSTIYNGNNFRINMKAVVYEWSWGNCQMSYMHFKHMSIVAKFGHYETWDSESRDMGFFQTYNLLNDIEKTYPSGYGQNDDIYYTIYYNGTEKTINNMQSFKMSDYVSYNCGDNTAYLTIHNPYPTLDGTEDGEETIEINITGAIQKAEKPSAISYKSCPGQTRNFTTNATNADSYQWEVTNNAASNISGSGSSVNITFDNAFSGNCQVRVRGSGCGGQLGEWSDYRDIHVIPPIEENSPMIICKNQVCPNDIDTLELYGFANYDVVAWYVDGVSMSLHNDISIIEELTDPDSKIVVKYDDDNMQEQYVISAKVANQCEVSSIVTKTVTMKGLDILNQPNKPFSTNTGYEVCGNVDISVKTNEILNATDMEWNVSGFNNRMIGEVIYSNHKDSAVVDVNDTYDGFGYIKVRAIDECNTPGPWSDSLELKIRPAPGQSQYIMGITSRTKNSVSVDTFKSFAIIYANDYQWNIDTGGTIIDSYIEGAGNATACVVEWDAGFTGESEITVRGINGCGYGKWNDPVHRVTTYNYNVNLSIIKGINGYDVVGDDTLVILHDGTPGFYIPAWGCSPTGSSPVMVEPTGDDCNFDGDIVQRYTGIPGPCSDFWYYECEGSADTLVFEYLGARDTIFIFNKYTSSFDSLDIKIIAGDTAVCANDMGLYEYENNIPWYHDIVFYDAYPSNVVGFNETIDFEDLPLHPHPVFTTTFVIEEDSMSNYYNNKVRVDFDRYYKGNVKIRARYANFKWYGDYDGKTYYTIDTSGWGEWYNINVRNLPTDNIIDTVIGTEFCAGIGNKTKIYLDNTKDYDTILAVGSSPPYGNASWNNDSVVFQYDPFRYGNYDIRINVQNECGLIPIKIDNIIIHKLPDVEISSGQNSLCEFDSVLFSASPGSGSWNEFFKSNYFMADSASIGNNLAQYEYTDTNGCTNFDTMTIEVIERPDPPAVDSAIYHGNLYTVFAYPYKNFNLSVDSRAGESYNFYNDTLFSLKKDAHTLNVFVLNDTGRHKYKIEAEHRGCRSTKKSNVLIKPVYKPGIPGIQVKNKDFEEKGTICLFDTVNLTSSLANNPDPANYHFKNIFLDDQKQKIAIDTLRLGSFNQDSIILYVATMDSIINQLGVFKNYSDTIKLNIKASIPDLPALYNPASHYCKWDDATLYIKDTVNEIHWFTRDDVMFADTNRLVLEKLQDDTTIICKRLNDVGCYSRDKEINIFIDSVSASFTSDLVEIDPGGRIEFTSTAKNNIKQKWWFGDGSMPNYFADIHHYYYNEGYFDVTLIAESEYGCHDTIIMKDYIKVGNPNFIGDVSASEIKIYPNPVKNILNIELKCKEKIKMMIMDITGKIILERYIISDKTTIDVNNWRPGIYLIQIDDKVTKIIKQ